MSREPEQLAARPEPSLAASRSPAEIEPWYGPPAASTSSAKCSRCSIRYCVGCHDGQPDAMARRRSTCAAWRQITDYTSVYHYGGHDAGHFSTSYVALHRFVRRPGLESDYHMLMPMEFHADTTQLVQLLTKGHYNVQLDAEAWDRLITWIDLNAPYHGTWTEIAGAERVKHSGPTASGTAQAVRQPGQRPGVGGAIAGPRPKIDADHARPPCTNGPCSLARRAPDWPFDAAEAQRRQRAFGPHRTDHRRWPTA